MQRSQVVAAAHRASPSSGHVGVTPSSAARRASSGGTRLRSRRIRQHWRGGLCLCHRSAVHPLVHLYRSLSQRRRRQLRLMLVVMLAGAGAELATIGAVLPFLAFLTRGGSAAMPGAAARWLAALGVHDIVSASLLLIAGAVGAAVVRLLLLWLN